MNEYNEYDALLAEEIEDYLALSDDKLAGYGLVRSVLKKQLADLLRPRTARYADELPELD